MNKDKLKNAFADAVLLPLFGLYSLSEALSPTFAQSVQKGNARHIRRHLEKDPARVNTPVEAYYEYPLALAVYWNRVDAKGKGSHYAAVDALLEKGAVQTAFEGIVPLLSAAVARDRTMLEKLLKNDSSGVNTVCRLVRYNERSWLYGQTALSVVAGGDGRPPDPACAALLREYAARLDASDRDVMDIVRESRWEDGMKEKMTAALHQRSKPSQGASPKPR